MAETAKPDAHSSVVGGSTAERRIMCPGSYQLEQKLPPSAKGKSSDYADEGTALHEAMTYILQNDITDLDTVLGMTFGADADRNPTGYVMTDDLVDNALAPCVDFFDALCDEAEEEGGLDFLVEQEVQMPGIPGAFGTSDIIARTQKRTIIVDWKFGVGVPVKAYYEEDGVKRPNYQLAYYARAAIFTLPHMAEDRPDWPVDLYIVQPRGRDIDPTQPYTHFSTTVKELEEFRRLLVMRIAEAQSDNPRVMRSPTKEGHCKFCPAKTVCPAHLGPAIDATKLAEKLKQKRGGSVLDGVDINWSVMYGELLDFAMIMEALAAEITTQAHAFMDEGNIICDEEGVETWKLVQKRPTARYVDEAGAVAAAKKNGVAHEDCFTLETKSPAQLRDALAAVLPAAQYGKTKKAREEKAKELLADFVTNTSSGTTVAPVGDNRRKYIPTAGQVNALSNKLASLVGK